MAKKKGNDSGKFRLTILEGVFVIVAALGAAALGAWISSSNTNAQIKQLQRQMEFDRCESAIDDLLQLDPKVTRLISNIDDLISFTYSRVQAYCPEEQAAQLAFLLEPEVQEALANGQIEAEIRADPATGRLELYLVKTEDFQPSSGSGLSDLLDKPIFTLPQSGDAGPAAGSP